MYEEIRRPKLLKDVPTSLIRALPTLYYTNKFSGNAMPELIQNLYDSNVVFLSQALAKIGDQLKNNTFTLLSDEAFTLKGTPSADLFNQTQKFSVKLAGTLKKLCHYHTDQTEPGSSNFSSKLLASDFALFYCISSPDIHKQIHSLTTYHIPCLAMMQIDREVAINQEAIRHGAQLMKIGFCVLYKMFTPIRLYTTIDKTYLHYNLQEKVEQSSSLLFRGHSKNLKIHTNEKVTNHH